MQLLDFDGIPLPDRMATYDIPATTALSRLNVVGGMGGYVIGAKRETRKYRVDGLYLSPSTSPSEAQQKLDRLRGAMGVKGLLRQKMKDGSIRRCNAWLTGVTPVNNNLTYITTAQPVTLDFESDELWYDDALTVSDLTSASVLYAVNAGNAATTRLKITITSVIASSLTITNTTNGEALVYGAAKASGVVLVIDCETGTVTIDGVNAYASTTRVDTQIALLSLAAGENILSFNVPVTGRVEYRGCFI